MDIPTDMQTTSSHHLYELPHGEIAATLPQKLQNSNSVVSSIDHATVVDPFIAAQRELSNLFRITFSSPIDADLWRSDWKHTNDPNDTIADCERSRALHYARRHVCCHEFEQAIDAIDALVLHDENGETISPRIHPRHGHSNTEDAVLLKAVALLNSNRDPEEVINLLSPVQPLASAQVVSHLAPCSPTTRNLQQAAKAFSKPVASRLLGCAAEAYKKLLMVDVAAKKYSEAVKENCADLSAWRGSLCSGALSQEEQVSLVKEVDQLDSSLDWISYFVTQLNAEAMYIGPSLCTHQHQKNSQPEGESGGKRTLDDFQQNDILATRAKKHFLYEEWFEAFNIAQRILHSDRQHVLARQLLLASLPHLPHGVWQLRAECQSLFVAEQFDSLNPYRPSALGLLQDSSLAAVSSLASALWQRWIAKRPDRAVAYLADAVVVDPMNFIIWDELAETATEICNDREKALHISRIVGRLFEGVPLFLVRHARRCGIAETQKIDDSVNSSKLPFGYDGDTPEQLKVEANNFLKLAQLMDDQNPQCYWESGRNAKRNGKVQVAICEYQKAAALYAERNDIPPALLADSGEAALEDRQYSTAFQAFYSGASRLHSSPRCWKGLASAAEKLGITTIEAACSYAETTMHPSSISSSANFPELGDSWVPCCLERIFQRGLPSIPSESEMQSAVERLMHRANNQSA